MGHAILKRFVLVGIIWVNMALLCHGAQSIVAQKVDHLPVIDGKADDAAWLLSKQVVTRDHKANIDISLQVVYTDQKVFVKVEFPDPDESRIHKPLIWNPKIKMYKTGPGREDTLVLKWAMDEYSTPDLSVHSTEPHMGDIWFWKANRTDPVGYADDKHQILSLFKTKKAKEVRSANGERMYLQRLGDQGEPAYKASILCDYRGDQLQQYTHRKPTGSRSDIMARGIWRDNSWCIEFSRNLITKHPDDVQFDPSKKYLFGVSRYEIAGRGQNPKLSQPLYGAGDVGEKLILEFAPYKEF